MIGSYITAELKSVALGFGKALFIKSGEVFRHDFPEMDRNSIAKLAISVGQTSFKFEPLRERLDGCIFLYREGPQFFWMAMPVAGMVGEVTSVGEGRPKLDADKSLSCHRLHTSSAPWPPSAGAREGRASFGLHGDAGNTSVDLQGRPLPHTGTAF